ncbi:VOC family protein [Variovorax sp. GB1R11]
MKPFTLHIPMPRKKGMFERMNAFYEGVLGYVQDPTLDVLRVPGHDNLAISFKYFDSKRKENDKEADAIYEFFIDKNFPSFCLRLKEKGVAFDTIARTPGFYLARFFDPSGNTIEVISESFEDDAKADIPGGKPTEA